MYNDQSQPPKQSFWSKIFGGGKKQEDVISNAPVDTSTNNPVGGSPMQPTEDQASSTSAPTNSPLPSTSLYDESNANSLNENSDPQISPANDMLTSVEQDIDSVITNSPIGQEASTGGFSESLNDALSGASFDGAAIEVVSEVPQPPADPMVTPIQNPAFDSPVTAEAQQDAASTPVAEGQSTEDISSPSIPTSTTPAL